MAGEFVRIRDPHPPHGALLTVMPSKLKYGFVLMDKSTATFVVSRDNENLADSAHLFRAGYAVSVERPDGLQPWFGTITRRIMQRGAPEIGIIATNAVRQLENSRTEKTGTVRGASGTIITGVLNEIDRRAEPPLMLHLDAVTGGPPLDYRMEMQSGLDFLNKAAQFTGWEWGFRHELTEKAAVTWLTWKGRQGRDRRDEVTWREDSQLEDVTYTEDADGYIGASVVVGGTGEFGSRTAIAVSRSGRSSAGVEGRVRTRSGMVLPTLNGTRVIIDRQVSDKDALIAAAQHDSPVHIAEQLSCRIVESRVDMDIVVGDVVSTDLYQTDPVAPFSPAIRVLGIGLDAESGVHDVETQILEAA